MDVKISVILGLALLAFATAFPASGGDTELIDPKFGDQPIVDTGVVNGGGFFDSPFDVFQNMDSMMKRMREFMNRVLKNTGLSSNGTLTNVSDPFGLPAIPNLDLGKGNTTSVTKIINGHKVVINETKYSNEDENGGSFYRVRVIEVKPEQDAEVTTSKPRDVESVEDSHENEIAKKVDNEAGNLELLDDIDKQVLKKNRPITNRRWRSELEDFEDDAENRIDGPLVRPIKPYDLGRDTYVNNLLAKRKHRMNPDVEFVPLGYDLKRDIRVNQLMAKRGVAPDPDAEFVDTRRRDFEKYITPR